MLQSHYDLVVAGGGIAGSTLALTMAREGSRVLVVEKSRTFSDRVRGEIILPWGVAEARTLGIEAILRARCGVDVPTEITYVNGVASPTRDFASTTPGHTTGLSFHHPEMQQVLLAEASAAGVDVRRGAVVGQIVAGMPASVEIVTGGQTRTVDARLVIGADGRDSRLATMLGFGRSRNDAHLFMGGFQCAGRPGAADALHFFVHGASGRGCFLIRTGADNHRIYIVHHKEALPRLLRAQAIMNSRSAISGRSGFHPTGWPAWRRTASSPASIARIDGSGNPR